MLRHIYIVIFFNFLALTSIHAFEVKELFADFEKQGNTILTNEQCKTPSLQIRFDDPSQPQVHNGNNLNDALDPALGFIEWTPTGLNEYETSLTCHPDRFEKKLLRTNSHREFSEVARNHYTTCRSELERHWPGSPQGLIQMVSIKYDFCDHPYVKKVHFNLPPFYKLRGYLGLKPGKEKKPLLILKCGAYCDAGDRSTVSLMTHTYDTSPFHVLLLGNFTGTEFVSDNQRVGIGGFEEGTKVVRLAQWLKEGPLGKAISSVHLAALSLGGHAALYSGFYNDYNYDKFGEKPLNSVFALCPVVDLKQSLSRLFKKDLNGTVMRVMFRSNIASVGRIFPGIDKIFKNEDGKIISNPELPNKIAQATVNFLKDKVSQWSMAPYLNPVMTDGESWFQNNDFLKDALGLQQTPLLMSGNRDDWVVSYDDNTRLLENLLKENPGVSSIEMLNVDKGNHCAMNVGYGWKTMSSLMRSFVLKNAPEFSSQFVMQRSPLQFYRKGRNFKLNEGELFIGTRWEVLPNRAKADVYFKILNRSIKGCEDETRKSTKSKCLRSVWAQVSNRHLPDPLKTPAMNKVQAEQMTRWANTNIIPVNDFGEWAYSGSSLPSAISWRGFKIN